MLDLRLALPDDVQHLAVGGQAVFAKCVGPEHADKKRPNMAVYADHLHCYACGFWLGCDGTCAERGHPEHTERCQQWQTHALALLLRTDDEAAAKLVPQYTAEALDSYRERAGLEARRDPLPAALADAYNTILLKGPRKHRMDWLRARGLDDFTIAQFSLGHDGFRFTIPIFDRDGNLLTFRYRRDDEYQNDHRPKYLGMTGRNGFYLYPEWRLVEDTKTWVVVCEGELDAARCWQQGWPAVSATNGARQVPKLIPALLSLRPDLKTVVLATDQDKPGEEASYEAGRVAEAAGLGVIRWSWDGAKDITEALALGIEPRREDYRERHALVLAQPDVPARPAA